jgi:TolB-like protein/Flp pilus assembly protein TadD
MHYRFEDYLLDVDRQELRRGANLVAIEPQVFDLLLFLIRNRDRVVSKDDLVAKVWNGRAISDSTLSSRITIARQTIGDSGEEQRLIRTVARKGLRFIGEVSEGVNSPAQQLPSASGDTTKVQPLGTLAETGVKTTFGKHSIAVLPFDNLSADPEQEYFSDGMAEDLITDLSKISGLSVAARHSSFTFKGRSADIGEVAKKLGVAFILEGSVRKMADRLRINAQLIDAAQGTHVWAERFDGDVAEIFDFQDRIRKDIIAALELKLTTAQASRSKKQRTTSLEAYDHLLRGRSEYYRYGSEHNAKAIEHFTAASKLDPNFAEPYSYLSYCYFARFMMMWPGADPDLGPALSAAEKAVSLDSASATTLSRLAWLLAFLRRYEESFSHFEKAIALEPNNAESLAAYAEVLNHFGDPERGLELNTQAVASGDAASHPNWEYNFGHSYLILRRYEEAIPRLRRAIELAPKFLPARVRLACAYAELDRLEEAKQEAAQILQLSPGFSVEFWDEYTPYRTPDQRERYRSMLRKAGLPE